MESVTAAEAAALGAWRTVDQQDRIGGLLFNDSQIEEIRPQRSKSAVMRILGALVKQNQALTLASNHQPNPRMLNEALQRAVRLAKHDFLVCLVTDGTGNNSETGDLLTRIAQHNDVLVYSLPTPRLDYLCLPAGRPFCRSCRPSDLVGPGLETATHR